MSVVQLGVCVCVREWNHIMKGEVGGPWKFQTGYVFVFGFPSNYGTHIIRRIQHLDNTQETSHYWLGGDQLLPLFQLIVQILINQAGLEGEEQRRRLIPGRIYQQLYYLFKCLACHLGVIDNGRLITRLCIIYII